MHLGKNMILHTANQTMILLQRIGTFFFPGQQWKTDFPGTAHVIQNKETRLEEPFWVDHFKKLNQEIPKENQALIPPIWRSQI